LLRAWRVVATPIRRIFAGDAKRLVRAARAGSIHRRERVRRATERPIDRIAGCFAGAGVGNRPIAPQATVLICADDQPSIGFGIPPFGAGAIACQDGSRISGEFILTARARTREQYGSPCTAQRRRAARPRV
jgi:hypothetical protein